MTEPAVSSILICHRRMFQRLIRSPIRFFDTNPVGRILNRFTSDTAAMDDSLPMTVFEFLGVIVVESDSTIT